MHAATMRAVVTRPAAIPEREKEATKYESSSGTGGTGMAPCDFALAVTSALSPQPSARWARHMFWHFCHPVAKLSAVARLGSVHLAHVVDIAVANGPALRWQYSGDGDRPSGEGGELHFVRGRVTMDMDNRPHIPR